VHGAVPEALIGSDPVALSGNRTIFVQGLLMIPFYFLNEQAVDGREVRRCNVRTTVWR